MSSLSTLIGVFERSLDAVEISDGEGHYVFVNAAFERFTGYASAEVLGKTPAEVLRSGMHTPEFYDWLWRSIQAGESVAPTIISRRKDGGLVTHEMTVTPILDEAGKVEWVIAVRRDLTARVAREEALRSTAALYEEVFRSNPAIKLLLDPETGALVDANEAALRFYGWSRETLLSMTIHEINTLSPEAVTAEMARAVREERTHFRFVHRIASGAERSVEVYTGPVHLAGRTRLMSIIQDVTDRERLEAELHRAQRMEAVGRLAGGVAHDFNNLLQVIVSSGSMLAKHLERGHPLRVHVDRIEDASHRGADLTRQLLMFSRGDTAGTDRIDVNGVVSDVARLLRATLGAHVTLLVESGPAVLPVSIARMSLEQVLLNLVVNARDAMEAGGVIRIATRVEPRTGNEHPRLPAGDYVLLEVADDGAGMDDAVLAHAFEPFFSTKGEGRGTGLGLAILYGIVQRAGGAVDVTSAPGKGSTFRIWLPIDEGLVAPSSRLAQTPAPKLEGASTTVLLVEDERDVRAVVAAMLAEHGFRVLVAHDAEHALELARSHGDALDLLLTDVVMPKTQGPELARRVRELCPRISVLFMSGYAGDDWERTAPEDARLIAKPFAQADLLAAVRGTRAPRE